MAQGFICEAANVTGITTSFALAQLITLGAYTTRDAYAVAVPSGGYWSHLDLQLAVTAGAPLTVTSRLFWDAAGNDPASGTSSVTTLQAGLTTGTLRLAGIGINLWPRYPFGAGTGGTPATGYTSGTLYLALAVNIGTVTLQKARLHWRDGYSGG